MDKFFHNLIIIENSQVKHKIATKLIFIFYRASKEKLNFKVKKKKLLKKYLGFVNLSSN